MKRQLEVASGIGVFFLSLLSSMAVLKMIFSYERTGQKIPAISIVSVALVGLAVLLSYIGAFILLSWANKPK